jgi:hypothetical protein
MRGLNLLFVLLINAVPLVGVKMFGWSVGVVLMLYWVENLLTAVFTTARIALHRALTRKRGHWRGGTLGTKVNNKPSGSGLLGEYALMAFVFTLAHGIFVVAIVFIIGENKPDLPNWNSRTSSSARACCRCSRSWAPTSSSMRCRCARAASPGSRPTRKSAWAAY